MKRHVLVPVLGALALAIAAPACAQRVGPQTRPSYGYSSDVQRISYDRGYREGVVGGERDSRTGRQFRYQDDRAYQRADVGYNRSYGDVGRYRQTFRQGFVDGYAEGYRRYARGGGYGAGGRYDDRGYAYPQRRDDRSLAPFDIGARDGFEKGREDARDNDRFDPRRHKWYRAGDREYNDRYGPRDRYQDEYRRGFLTGYERGYRGR